MSFHIAKTIANAVDLSNSGSLFSKRYFSGQIPPMDISEIRRRNLREWIDSDPVSLGNAEAWCSHYSQGADKPISPTYIRQLAPESGKAARNIGEKTARRLEAAGGKPSGWLDANALGRTHRDSVPFGSIVAAVSGAAGAIGAAVATSLLSNVSEGPRLLPSTDVPVVGTVQGGDQGFFVELEHPVGHGDGCITYPARDANSYALRVRGDSMRPRIKNGEFIVVEPNYPPQPGDDVVVCLLDGRRMVKELLYIRDGEITLGSINNGHGNITVSVEQVEKMHYVAAIIPRGAFYRQNEHI